MRKVALVGLFLASMTAVPAAFACDVPGGGGVQVQIVVEVSPAAAAQSLAFTTEATRLDGKAATEEKAATTFEAASATLRRKARTLRVQAAQAPESSRLVLLAKAQQIELQAEVKDSGAVTLLLRAKQIRARATALRKLAKTVVQTGFIATAVLPRVKLPAPPSGHPDVSPLLVLEAAPATAPVVWRKAEI